MAVLPAGAVAGIEGELRVLEDLTSADAPIIFEGTTRRFEITKSGERIVPTNASGLWGGRGDKAVLAAGADLLGNAILSRTPDDPTYAEVAPLLPPVLATSLHCGDFALGTQSFVGSRVATEKRSFSAMGVDAWANTRQQYHFDVEQLSLNNTRAVRKPPARASTPSQPPIPPSPTSNRVCRLFPCRRYPPTLLQHPHDGCRCLAGRVCWAAFSPRCDGTGLSPPAITSSSSPLPSRRARTTRHSTFPPSSRSGSDTS